MRVTWFDGCGRHSHECDDLESALAFAKTRFDFLKWRHWTAAASLTIGGQRYIDIDDNRK